MKLATRLPDAGDTAFLEALYLDSRPDLTALPVPRSVVDGIARHQRQLQLADYALRYPGADTRVITDAGEPVARIVLACMPDSVRVVDLAVAAHARRRGIARAVLQTLQQKCTGRRVLALRVRKDNTAAGALYRGLGFVTARDDGATLELVWSQNE